MALMTVLGARPATAADYSWFASGKGLSAGGWSGGANWLPTAPAGGPTAADNVIPSTAFGDILVDIPNAAVTNWTSFVNVSQVVDALSVDTDNVSLTISGNLSKSGTGALTFRNFVSTLSVSVGTVSLSGGSLLMGDTTQELSAFSAGSVDISGGTLFLNVQGPASITSLVSMSGSGALYLAQVANSTRSVSIGALSSASPTALVSSNSGTTSTLHLTATSGEETYAGIIQAGGNPATLAVVKDGDGTQIFSGNSNTYNGGTTINAGTLLINNTSGSGTGTGRVTINGGELGGTGIVAPTGTNGITVAEGGNIVPGDPTGALTFDMGGTTGIVNLQSGGDFGFELGPANSLIGSIAVGSSGLLVISGASAGDVAFGTDTDINLFGSANGVGYYKLFATSAGAATWTGLTLGAATTGGNVITGGLTAGNFGQGYSGFLILGDGSAGTTPGDIYLAVIPEPSTVGFLAAAGLLSLITIRTRRRS